MSPEEIQQLKDLILFWILPYCVGVFLIAWGVEEILRMTNRFKILKMIFKFILFLPWGSGPPIYKPDNKWDRRNH